MDAYRVNHTARQRLRHEIEKFIGKINDSLQSSSKSMSIADSPVRRVSVSARVIQFLPSSSFAAFLSDKEEGGEGRMKAYEQKRALLLCLLSETVYD